jgi:cephalosporin hydroxylase
LHYDGITFLQGDCLKIETVFPSGLLETAPHPWLFVEDAHVNVCGVLTYFHQFFTTGDYVVVEDSGSKHEAIGKFLARHSGCYKLDTRYTDFFGRNATCARDSIFVRI